MEIGTVSRCSATLFMSQKHITFHIQRTIYRFYHLIIHKYSFMYNIHIYIPSFLLRFPLPLLHLFYLLWHILSTILPPSHPLSFQYSLFLYSLFFYHLWHILLVFRLLLSPLYVQYIIHSLLLYNIILLILNYIASSFFAGFSLALF